MSGNWHLHFHIFTRQQLAKEQARALVRVVESLQISKFGSAEPVREKYENAADEAATLLIKDHFLILKGDNPRWSGMLSWQAKRTRPWFWTFDFAQQWQDDSRRAQMLSTMTDLCKRGSAVFAAGGLMADWLAKHEIRDSTGAAIDRRGDSFGVGEGLPGIYWFNYFGAELIEHFGFRSFLDQKVRVLDRTSTSLAFLAYDSPDGGPPEARRAREHELVDALGSEFFFDLAKASGARPRKRSPILNATDAKTLRG